MGDDVISGQDGDSVAQAAILAGPDDENEFEDFEAWLTAEQKPARVKVCGVLLTAPQSLPLKAMMTLSVDRGSTEEADPGRLADMVDLIFPPGTGAKMLDAGADPVRLAALLLWGTQHAVGRRPSMRECYEQASQAFTRGGDALGEALTRGATSSATGGTSAPISGASTESPRAE